MNEFEVNASKFIEKVLKENELVMMKRNMRKQAYIKKILKVAAKIFFEKGYNSVSVDEIARQADITKRTLYKYFPSKVSIYAEIIIINLQKLRDEFSKNDELSLPPDQYFLKDLDTLFKFTRKNIKFMRLYWMIDANEFDLNVPAKLLKRIHEQTHAIHERWGAHLQRHHAEGKMKEADVSLLVHFLAAVNKGIFVHASQKHQFAQVALGHESAQKIFNLFKTVLQNALLKSSLNDKLC